VAGVIVLAWRRVAGVRELPCESGPAVDLDEDVGQVDDRQLVGDLLRELVDVGLTRLGPEPLDAEVALRADRHVGVGGLQVTVEHVAMPRGAFEQQSDAVVGDGGQLQLAQDGRSRSGPVGAGDQEALGVGVAAAALHPDLTSTKGAAHLRQ
jgi:hypothetical protein